MFASYALPDSYMMLTSAIALNTALLAMIGNEEDAKAMLKFKLIKVWRHCALAV